MLQKYADKIANSINPFKSTEELFVNTQAFDRNLKFIRAIHISLLDQDLSCLNNLLMGMSSRNKMITRGPMVL